MHVGILPWSVIIFHLFPVYLGKAMIIGQAKDSSKMPQAGDRFNARLQIITRQSPHHLYYQSKGFRSRPHFSSFREPLISSRLSAMD